MRAVISGATWLLMSSAVLSTATARASVVTEAECLSQVSTALERLYCRVKAGGEGDSLPDLEDFRKNSEIAQKELLWSPARRLGLTLPGAKPGRPPEARALPMGIRYSPPDDEATSAAARAQMVAHSGPLRAGVGVATAASKPPSQIVDVGSSSRAATRSEPSAVAATHNLSAAGAAWGSAAVRTTTPATPTATPSTAQSAEEGTAISTVGHAAAASRHAAQKAPSCALRGVEISCGSAFYQLALNRPKHALPASVLDQANRLELPRFEGDIADERAVRAYLNEAYAAYIDKMLGLGLAGSTMSFSTFYYSFKDQVQRNIDFAGRFQEMFEFLKADRQKLAVSTAKPSELPQSLGQCATLTSDIIVCDNLKHNWVYVRQETL